MTTIRRDLMIESEDGDSETFQQALAVLDRAVEELGKLGQDARVEQKADKRRQYKKTFRAARPATVIE